MPDRNAALQSVVEIRAYFIWTNKSCMENVQYLYALGRSWATVLAVQMVNGSTWRHERTSIKKNLISKYRRQGKKAIAAPRKNAFFQ